MTARVTESQSSVAAVRRCGSAVDSAGLSGRRQSSAANHSCLQMAGANTMEKILTEFKCDTNEAICLKLVRFPEDLEDEGTTFHPEYSHQLYGDE
ncbi:hypothetical protein CRUP_013104 [Coryphaenoides rupestris]|nr:hypothetical protein CRUP_013104 [Coryphaenoides rupestris]